MKRTISRKLKTVFAAALSFAVFAVSSVGISATTAQKVYNGITFDAWTDTSKMPSAGGNYYLTDNVDNTSHQWTLNGDQKLDLNGKTANIQYTYVNGKTLSIYDSSEGSGVYSTDGGNGAFYGSGGTLNIYGGTFTGGSAALVNNTAANVHGGDVQYGKIAYNGTETIVVDGGTFAADPTNYLASGSTMTSVGGKYAVNYTAPAPAAEPQVEADSHVHSYEWVSVKGATDGEDEVMQYRCSCGDVKQEMKVANSAFNNFNQNTANQISKAASGSTVRIEMGNFTAIHQMIFDAMRQRTDVNVEFIFRDQGNMYSLTVPGGANLSTLPGGAAYTNTDSCGCEGIYYLAQQTKTVATPLN